MKKETFQTLKKRVCNKGASEKSLKTPHNNKVDAISDHLGKVFKKITIRKNSLERYRLSREPVSIPYYLFNRSISG